MRQSSARSVVDLPVGRGRSRRRSSHPCARPPGSARSPQSSRGVSRLRRSRSSSGFAARAERRCPRRVFARPVSGPAHLDQGTRSPAGTPSARAIRSRFRRVQFRSPRSQPATYDQLRSDFWATAWSVRPAARRASRTRRPNSTRSGFLGISAGTSPSVTANQGTDGGWGGERPGKACTNLREGARGDQFPNPRIDIK